nr:MAG TPA: hypothetical protein [Caudoviricetes sp.]
MTTAHIFAVKSASRVDRLLNSLGGGRVIVQMRYGRRHICDSHDGEMKRWY